MKKYFTICIVLFSISLLLNMACTKLDTRVYDQISDLNQVNTKIQAGVGAVYSGLRSYAPGLPGDPGVYNLNEMSSDEIIVPNRGQDWNDNNTWAPMWKHTWHPNHEFMLNGWQFIYGGIARVNSILQIIEESNPKPADAASISAGIRAIRAFYYYQAIDLYGNVPIAEVNATDLSKLGNQPREVVFNYIEKELKEILNDLPKEVNETTYGRSTYWFAKALLAKLYLNAEVFTGNARWTDCISACNEILSSNKYILEPNFFINFSVANQVSKENIFAIPFDINAGMELFLIQGSTLHYNSNATFGLQAVPGGFNGFCSTAEYYNIFHPGDLRRKMFLVGQQYVNQIEDEAHRQYDNYGNLLIFDPVITTFVLQAPKTETAGARCAKWEFNKIGWGNMSNDFVVYRLADIILMKAEAQYRMNDINAALTTINQKLGGVSIRSRANMPDFSASELTADGLLAERAREFSWEGFRRNDMIRLGHFLDARIPEKVVSAEFRKLFPIPETELAKNPYLEQNPGY